MHEEAFRFVAGVAMRLEPRVSVVELGSRTVAGPWPYSGSVRHLFPGAGYVGVDAVDGPNVDIVDNEAAWQPEPFLAVDTVVCTETLEHTPQAGLFCARTDVLRAHPYEEGDYPHWGSDVYQSFQLMAAGYQLADVPTVRSVWRSAIEGRGWKYVHQGG